MWTTRTTVTQKEVRREGGEPGGGSGDREQGARIKEIFGKVADQQKETSL